LQVKQCKEALGGNLYHQLRKEKKLPLKYIMFVAEYVTNGFNATEAYMRSIARKGSKREGAQSHAVGIVADSRVAEAIKIVIEAWLGEKRLKLEKKIVDQLYRRAFYDPSMFVKPNGVVNFKEWEEIPEEWRCCIDGIEKKKYWHGKESSEDVIILRMANRDKAREELSKYIVLYKEISVTEHRIADETKKKLDSIFRNEKAADITPIKKERK
jgi:hypothetical protein